MNATSFVSIRLSTLKGSPLVPFNIYVKVNQKYVPFILPGDPATQERLDRLRKKSLKQIFIRLEEEELYRQFLDHVIEMAFNPNSDQSVEKRAEVIQGYVESNTEAIYDDPGNPTNYKSSKVGSDKYIEFLLNENKAIHAMLTSENLNPNLVSHAVTVATLAVALAQKLGITDNTAMQNLGFGALLHDIGHMNQDYEIERPLDQFSKEELFNYHHHPQVAAARLTEKQPIDPVVLRIVQQHEERIDGSGFPNSLRGEQTDPLALMVSSCNAVDRLITFEKTPREVAIKKLLVEKVGLHPLEHIQGLQEILAEISRA